MIDGPRLPPASGGPARKLVVFLHGFGADGNDLIAIGQEWQRLLPDAAFVSPHAPDPCAGAPMGRQWFAITRLAPDEYWTGVQQAAPELEAFLDSEIETHGLGAQDLALVGFSQGTMMALHVGLRRATAPAAIVGYSGIVAGPEHLAEQMTASPPVLLIHGDSDEMIPVQALFHTAQALGDAGLSVTWHVSPGVGHGIDPTGLQMGGQFLCDAFAGKLTKVAG